MIYNQIVTWTAFAILAMFTNWSRPLCIIYWSECIIFEPLELKVDDKVFDKLFACLKKKKVIKKTLKYPKHENGDIPILFRSILGLPHPKILTWFIQGCVVHVVKERCPSSAVLRHLKNVDK